MVQAGADSCFHTLATYIVTPLKSLEKNMQIGLQFQIVFHIHMQQNLSHLFNIYRCFRIHKEPEEQIFSAILSKETFFFSYLPKYFYSTMKAMLNIRATLDQTKGHLVQHFVHILANL